MNAPMTDDDLIRAAGCGSYDGAQEHAMRWLLARLTARRAIELYPPEQYAEGVTPQGDYRVSVAKYSIALGE